MMQGFGPLEGMIVLLNGAGGLLIAATMKYADAIVKCLANALAIIVSTLLSVPLFGFHMSDTFLVGGVCTVVATSLYAWAPVWTLPGLLSQAPGTRHADGETELQPKEATPLVANESGSSREMAPCLASSEDQPVADGSKSK